MPLAERVIEPSNLGEYPINLRESEDGTVHHSVATNCLIGALYQLASLVRQADDIFCDISDECQKVLDRTQNINKKIDHINYHVQNLDAKNVKIPIGDLSTYSRGDDHHTAKHGFEINLFTVDSRSQCITDRYNVANQTPACKLRGADLYRKDGLCTERLFTLCPIVLNEHKVRTPDLNLPRKMQSVFTFEKRYKKLKTRPKTITSLDELYNEEEKKNKDNEKPYDVPRCPPSEKVSINISGQSFQQMESFRKALVHIEREDAKKKKKRKSMSGVPEDIMKEIEKFEKKRRSTNGHDVGDYLFDDLDQSVDQRNRDEEMAKYFDEVDAKMEERMDDEVLMKERKILKFLPCRRSKSLPRCVRLYKPNEKRQSVVGSINAQGSSLSLASNGTCASRISRSTKRSSIISNKFKILVSGNSKSPSGDKPRPRPKSLDLDAIDFNNDMARSNLAQTKMPSMPDGVFNNTTAEMRKNIGPGSYYNYESNTLPRRQPKRSESPWEYLPKDWTSSVKLREINKVRSKEDRQSSSGHWSGTNSNRHSLDSDNVKSDIMPKSTSEISLGPDSGRGSPIPQDERGSTDTNGGYIGDGGSTVTDGTSIQDGKLDTDNWLRTLAIRAATRDEISTSSAETLNSLTKLTRQNIEALDLMMSPSGRKPRLLEDEECSEYSVDQEGFYTSFHNDSGLRKSSATLVDEDELSHSKDSHSICSFESVIHNPESDKFAGIKKNQNNKSLSKVKPPRPPKRTSSMCSIQSQSKETSPGGISRQDSMFSDTDQETFFQRVEDKSKISSHGIPSLCTLTSDDDSVLGKGEGSGELYNSDKDPYKIVDMNENFEATGALDPSSFSQFSEGRTIQTESSSMDGISVFTITSGQSMIDFDQSESVQNDCQTLPRKTKIGNFDGSEYTKSWPRSNKKEDTKSILSSILKNNDSSKPSKSLYFSPMLNMFDSATQEGVACTMPQSSPEEPKTASKEELEKMGDNSSYMLSIPMADGYDEESKPELPTKYQPVLVVKPGVGRSEINASENDRKTCENQNLQTKNTTAKINFQESSFAITGNPKNNSSENNCTNVNTSSLSNFTGSINSINSEFSMPDSLTYVSMTSNCSSPNLSNMDIPAVLTPTESMDSLVNATKQCSDSIDNSNLSTTVETIAISTNSFSSFNNTNDNDQKSFRTFSGEMIPVSPPFSTSTPYSSSAGLSCQQPSMNHFQESPVSYSHHKLDDQQRGMKSSRSCPSDMKNSIQNVQNVNIQSKRHSIGIKPHPVVNLNYMDNSNQPENALPSNRTDSYRVAMVNPTRSGSYRVAMNESSSYPSFNSMSRRSTTPRINVTNQVISQSHNQQTTSQNRPNDQMLSQDQHIQSYQGHQSSGGSGKSRYNPLYASTSDAAKTSSSMQYSQHQKHLPLQNQSKDQNQSRRRSYEKQPSPSLDLHQKHPSPSQGRHQKQPSPSLDPHQKHPSPSQGRHQKQPSPSLDPHQKHPSPSQGRHQKHHSPSLDPHQKHPSPSQGHHQKHPSPSQGRHQKQPSPSQGRHQNKQFAFQGNQGKQTVSLQNQENYHKQSVKVDPQSTGHSYSAKHNSSLNKSNPLKQENKSGKFNSANVRSNPNMSGLNSNDNSYRTDSYRVALATNFDNPARNTSYRVAVKDTDPVIFDNRLDVVDSIMSAGRDSRRMGITNIDQAKSVPKTMDNKDTTPESQKQQVVRRRKPDVDPISVLQTRESNSSKTNKNRFSTSSTFIQFDPISEDWEFMMNSSDSLSQFSNNSDRDLVDHSGIVTRETVKVNSMSGGKMNQEKSSTSLLGSIKSTLKSMSGK